MTDNTPDPLAARTYEAIERIVENELTGVPSWRIGLTRRLTEAALDATRPSGDGCGDADCVFRPLPHVHGANGSVHATRPSGDEALRAAAIRVDQDFGAYGEMTTRYAPSEAAPIYEYAKRVIADALATPSSAPDVEGLLRALTIAVGDYKYLISPRDGKGTCTICHASEGSGHASDHACGKLDAAYVAALTEVRWSGSSPKVEIPDGVYVLEPRDVFDRAFRGVVHQGGVRYSMYSKKATIEALILYDGLDPTDAVEHYDFNVSGSIGVGFPVFLEDEED